MVRTSTFRSKSALAKRALSSKGVWGTESPSIEEAPSPLDHPPLFAHSEFFRILDKELEKRSDKWRITYEPGGSVIVATYPSIYRIGAAALHGGLRGVGYGPQAAVVSATVAALLAAFLLSKEGRRLLNPLVPPPVDPTRSVDVEDGVPARILNGWTFIKNFSREFGYYGPSRVFPLPHNPAHPGFTTSDEPPGVPFDVADYPTAVAHDMHTISGAKNPPIFFKYQSYDIYHKNAGTTVRAVPQTILNVSYFQAARGERRRELQRNLFEKVWNPARRNAYPEFISVHNRNLVHNKLVRGHAAPRTTGLSKTHEMKIHLTMFGVPMGVEFIGALFEVLDFIEALYRGLDPGPWHNPTTIQMLDWILRHLDEIDFETVGRVLEDQLQDFAIGLGGRAAAGLSRAAGLPVGLQRSLRPILRP